MKQENQSTQKQNKPINKINQGIKLTDKEFGNETKCRTFKNKLWTPYKKFPHIHGPNIEKKAYEL